MGSLLGCSLAAILLASTGATGPTGVETTIQDDAVLLNRPERDVRQAAQQIKDLGADRVRLTASWSGLAPSPQSRTKPGAPFDAADTRTYPQDGLRRLDRAVRAIDDAGLKSQIDLAFWAPRWAVRKPSREPGRQRYFPNSADFAAFARAIAKRYSGHFTDPKHGIGSMPAVHLYTTWNEPNYKVFLRPQWVHTRRGGHRPFSPHVYRAMHEAAYAEIKSVDRQNQVLIGGLAPTGSKVAGHGNGVSPLLFLRTMACVDRALQPLRVPECRGAGPLHADGFAMHPYSLRVAPGEHARNPDDVYLADLSRLDALLTALRQAGRIDRDWPVYVTEYGYETRPPDPSARYTPEQQARYLGWATFLAQSDPRVAMFAQFLLRDIDPAGRADRNDFQTGLLYPDGRAKPAAQAFKIPLFASYATGPKGNAGLVLYGGVRPGAQRRVVRVERRTGPQTWEVVSTVGANCDQDSGEFATDADGFFRRTAAWQGAGYYRLGWQHNGGWEYGATIPVDDQPLLAVAPPPPAAR
jgi:hypothetical protein